MPEHIDVCTCIRNEIDHLPKPLFRLVCHCETCRKYTGSDYYDECTFLLKDCTSISLDKVNLKSYQSGFSPMKRGHCKECGKISYSTIRVWPFPAFLMVPSKSLEREDIPKPFAHLYYKSRIKDMSDVIRKINGHLLSQLAIQFNILKGLLARRQKS